MSTAGLGIRDPRQCADLSPDQIIDLAVRADRPESDGIFLSCANVRGFEAADALEQRLGKPVVTSNQVVLWALLGLVGGPPPAANAGHLFQTAYKEVI